LRSSRGGRNSSTQLRILLLDGIGAFLNDHVHDVLDATVRDDREETGVNDSELFGAVDAVIAVDHTLGDALTQVTRAAGVEARLRALEDHGGSWPRRWHAAWARGSLH